MRLTIASKAALFLCGFMPAYSVSIMYHISYMNFFHSKAMFKSSGRYDFSQAENNVNTHEGSF